MKLNEIMDILEAEVITGEEYLSREVLVACASDLMSDVLAYGQTNSILLTGLATAQVIYTVEMAGNQAVCFVRGKRPLEDAVRLAEEKGFVLLCTHLAMFESCGRLYLKGLKGSFAPISMKARKPEKGRRRPT
jgi:predicted transcriptional regulator